MEEEREDLWTATDKFYHLIFCFTLTLLFSLLVVHTRHRFLRRHSIVIAASLSLLAGAARVRRSPRVLPVFRCILQRAVADFADVIIACLLLSISKFLVRKPNSGDHVASVEFV